MSKLKKIISGFGAFILGIASKVHADLKATDPLYGPPGGFYQGLYGVDEPTMGQKISKIGAFVIPIILFFIGLFVILSKKITNKIKVIVISILIILAVLSVFLMNYLRSIL